MPLSEVTPLVGYNNAGKSNILQACRWFLAPYSLQASDFLDPAVPVEMVGTVTGLDEEALKLIQEGHRKKLEPFLSGGTITLKRRQVVPAAGVKQIELLLLNPANGEFQVNPAGIPAALDALFPEPIAIGAMENVPDEVGRAKASNTIGKLLSALLAPIERDQGEKIRGQISGLRNMLGADGSERVEALKEFDTEASDFVSEFFPGISVRVDVPLPEIKDVFKSGTIRVYEGAQCGRDLTSLGHGAQRCVQMALVRMLAQKESTAGGRTLLLIDEPELYLHPQAIEQLRAAFRRLTRAGYQVIYSTHSPVMLDERATRDIVLVRKDANGGTIRRMSVPEAIEKCATDHEHQCELIFSLSHAANVLFAEKVVLAEGKTERHVLPALVDHLTGESLGASQIALVSVDGSASIHGMSNVVRALDLPCKVVADLDFVFQAYAKLELELEIERAIQRCIDHFTVLQHEDRCVLGPTGLPMKSDKAGSASAAYVALAADPRVEAELDAIIADFRSVGIWIWRRGDIEEHLGLTEKNARAWSTLCEAVRVQGLEVAVKDPDSIMELVTWLLE